MPDKMLLHICQVVDHSVANATSASILSSSLLAYLTLQRYRSYWITTLMFWILLLSYLHPSRAITPFHWYQGLSRCSFGHIGTLLVWRTKLKSKSMRCCLMASSNQTPARFLLPCSWSGRKTGHIGSVWIFASLMLLLRSLNFQSLFSISLWMNLALLAGFPHWISVLVFIRYYCSLEKNLRQHFKLIAANMNSMSWPLVWLELLELFKGLWIQL